MTDVGCPIHGSAIFRAEKGSPLRRIDVDEAAALAEVFGISIGNLFGMADRRLYTLDEVIAMAGLTRADLIDPDDREPA